MIDNYDFITSVLNVKEEDILNLSSVTDHSSITFKVTLKDKHPECPFCAGKAKSKGYLIRTYKHSSIINLDSVIEWKRRRYQCNDCKKTFSEENPFGPENYHMTYALLSGLAIDFKNVHLTFQDIAKKNNISITAVELYADSFLRVPRITLPENIGIDEIHSNMAKYGGSFLCTMVDNQKRCLFEILPDRSKRTLSRYLSAIPLEERKRVKFVTMDMWEPYKDCSKLYFPNCEIAVDPFHVIKHLNDAFDKFRISIQNQVVYNSPAYHLLKKWNGLFNDDIDLDNEPRYNHYFKQKMNYRDLYNLLIDVNQDLTLAYYLKERFRKFNKESSFEEAPDRLAQLIKEFEAADLPCYQEFLSTVKNWQPEIINSFKRPYNDKKQSNALAENRNGKLKELILIAHGYSNFERFRARAIYSLNDYVFFNISMKLNPKKRKGKKRGEYVKTKKKKITEITN